MSDSKDTLKRQLQVLGLDADETEVYIQLLQAPSTHLRLSRDTGISRTKIYRLVALLEKRSLISKRTDDRGTFLVASDPSTLEVELITKEEELKQQRATLQDLLPSLTILQAHDSRHFVVRTYEGFEGLKQMCWHELKAKDEVLTFGFSKIEALANNTRWAEKHRTRTVAAGYRIRDLINDTPGHDATFSANQAFMQRYRCRRIPATLLPMDNQTIVYNDTVAIYHTSRDQVVGVEITNKAFAEMMRTMFNHYWDLGTEVQPVPYSLPD